MRSYGTLTLLGTKEVERTCDYRDHEYVHGDGILLFVVRMMARTT